MKYRDQAEFKLKLSRNVKRFREKRGLTQARLAEVAFVSADTLRSIEDGLDVINHTIFPLIKIAKYFNVTLDELLYGSTELDEEKKLFYKIKSLSPVKRELIESYVMHN